MSREVSDTVYAVVAAAGSGRRLGRETPKAFVDVSGRTVLERCLDGLAAAEAVDHTVVTVPADMVDDVRTLVDRQRPLWGAMSVQVVAGGGERIHSVLAGLHAVAAHAGVPHTGIPDGGAGGESGAETVVAVHDAARCLTPPTMIATCVETAREGLRTGGWAGVVPALPVTDTVKIVDAAGVVRSTPARETLRAAQTPQVFGLHGLLRANRMNEAREELDSAHPTGLVPGPLATDDSSLMELAGERVLAVAGDPQAFKITWPDDLDRAVRLVEGEE
ncbi:MAG TPA: 2-C-methyl-D-erythritol 4-phosphate cytidylyltransferase [Corynebacterium nuruki]|jgi:2-C-methyl-D-erythritol 4-phosphate cytidylyltransferase|uniref:2-C-methyl-D-erythritol 4-phosphate cytidylyltransferase n=2 Tax=Corynebacterium nuruki TaxID=1032851 RepID=A0A3D4T1R5_9CORY|nr:2-C-methyl-D-erythritol 4-phosphate cytidylyltransferase [Corynebacterium nuruki]HCT15469.1 2-C-methyl-D-erythritol 4-phosphate cytidylyltransferase [Corynebacterium nuruki]